MGTTTGAVNGVALRAFRERLIPKISQERLADLVGCSQDYISHIEAGRKRHPNMALLNAIALQLNVPVAAITYPREACPTCDGRKLAA